MSNSSAEAKYWAIAHVVDECKLLQELHTSIPSATIVYCDNISAIFMTNNSIHRRRTKHIEIGIHSVYETVALGKFKCYMSLRHISLRTSWLRDCLYNCLVTLGLVFVSSSLPLWLWAGIRDMCISYLYSRSYLEYIYIYIWKSPLP
jgi:hypothetical protein